MKNKNKIILLVSGKKGSGKSIFVESLTKQFNKNHSKNEINVYTLAKPIKEYTKDLERDLGSDLTNREEKEQFRGLFQEIGKVIRNVKPNFLIDKVIERIKTNSNSQIHIIEDVRLTEELKQLNKFGLENGYKVVSLRIEDDTKPNDFDSTETELDHYLYWDFIINKNKFIQNKEVDFKKLDSYSKEILESLEHFTNEMGF